ncbi:bifunctional adenosylcobinamide kinase/adenosylcobinamide-phosphate guanylyltransferase [Peribacillus sp. SCS-155]|uniref:bifunctional adenosylcobinamide kinase/adenosylcobinamide-phosphate guanylyltransferase n=1 Tax=Peribacillus sedimenti TaxID=3115297 RepID=UPI00390658B1
MESSLIFITGGARSGKSSFAENLGIQLAQPKHKKLYYVACGLPVDREMEVRIKRHKLERQNGSMGWENLEVPASIENALAFMEPGGIVLVDCLTTLLTNEMFPATGSFDEWMDPSFTSQVKTSILNGILSIQGQAAATILVSNEVLQGMPSIKQEMLSVYSRTLGQLHQCLVEKADRAYLMENGIPMLMKGRET